MLLRSLILPRRHRDFLAAERRGHFSEAGSDAVCSRQLASLQTVWNECTTDIPHYSNLVRQGLAPSQIRSWQEFRQIPVLTRQDFQNDPEQFIRRSAPPEDFIKTAGSTGTPLRLGMNQQERELMRLTKLAAWQHFGYTENSRLFLIWGHSHLLGTGWRGRLNHFRRKAADQILGYRRVDAYSLNRDLCRRYAQDLIRWKPTGLIGYASALDLFSHHTGEFRDAFRSLGLTFVLSTSEPPPKPDTFDRLQELFGCPVVQEYGGAEFGQVAFKNGPEPFEVYPDLNHVELDPSSPADSEGQPILVTSLYPRYMPLIRYRVGDAVAGPQLLENGHVSRFAAVAGRVNDVIPMGDGQSVHSVAIFHCLHQEPSIQNIQLHLRDDMIQLRLISTQPGDKEVESRILARLRQVHPLLGTATLHYVEDLVTNRAGKRRWFVDERSAAAG